MKLASPLPIQRVGVYGGAFDPPHSAHTELARAAIQQLQLDALHILPTGQAWHKQRNLTSAEHRVAMTRLAFAPLARAQVDEREIRRSGPTYTVDTLRELAAEYPDAQLFLLMGQDQAESLSEWHEIDEIKRLAIICVAERDAPEISKAQGQVHSQDVDPVVPGNFRKIVLPLMPHSATDIRLRVASGHPLNALVCETVARYIQDHHLYLTAR